MFTLILAILAGAAFVFAKIGEAQGRTADEKMGSLPFYAAAALLAIATLVSLAF